MSMLEKFKNQAMTSTSMKLVKGGHEPMSWYDCTNENGGSRPVPVNYGENLYDKIDAINADPHEWAIVGCEP